MKKSVQSLKERTIKKYKHHKFSGVEIDLINQAYKCFLSLSHKGQDLLFNMMNDAIESDRENGLREKFVVHVTGLLSEFGAGISEIKSKIEKYIKEGKF